MTRRQRIPRRWLVADTRTGGDLWRSARRLPRGSGILVIHDTLPKRERARLLSKLRTIARRRNLVVIDELKGEARRIHDVRELRQAGLADVPLLFLSPLFRTRSHPDRKPFPRLKAAALLRLAKSPAIALGGMNERRFRRLERLGFQGWAGIDAWLRT